MLSTLDWFLIAVYFTGVLGLGLRFSRRQKSLDHYFLGTRRFPGWAVGISMFSTMISSWAFLALPGKAYQSDLQYLLVIISTPLATWVTVQFLIPLYRKKIRLSAYEYLEKRFGTGARVYGNLAFLIVHYGKMGAVLYLLCLAISSVTGWNIFVLIGFVGLLTLVYTFLGGIEGVIWTDVVQGILLLGSGLLSIGYLLWLNPGGGTDLLQRALSAGKFQVFSFEFSWQNVNTWTLLVFGSVYFLQKFVSDQTVVQRYLLSSSTRNARHSLWLSTCFLIVIWVIFMSLGVLLWSYYEGRPGLLPAEVSRQPDQVFPYFIGHELPSGVTGLILAGLFAATMSTLSSDLNSLASVLTEDYYLRWVRKPVGEKRKLLVSRVCVLVSGFLAVLLAMSMTEIQSMADAAFNFVSLVAGGVLGMYLLGIFDRRCSARGLYAGIAAGIPVALWIYFQGSTAFVPVGLINPLWIGLFCNLTVVIVGYIVSHIFTRDHRADESLLAFGPMFDQDRVN